ncbi:hypothetical protein [Alteribacter populi]|uniref:hypothetical protein n=1 Tax=Alteribacter populi TaxID=2011011 RepID=UPI000BBAF0F3|nr:hypothetical protein [Alteribacter populi]
MVKERKKMSYDFLSYHELVAYYARVKKYIDDGFRVDGLREELELILRSLVKKAEEENEPMDKAEYEREIRSYIRLLRN